MIKKAFIFSILSVFVLQCNFNPTANYTYRPPPNLYDGLEPGSLQEVGIDSVLIKKAVSGIIQGKFNEIHSLLIYKNSKLVLEEYFPGHQYKWDAYSHHGELVNWNPDMLHDVMSVSKSITSACIGIAIKQGFIENVHASIFDYLPNHQHLRTREKEKITIEHLLTMTSGLEGNEWNAPYSSPKNPVIALWYPPCNDAIECVLEKPLNHEPGTHFNYFGGGIIVLGEILKNATGMEIDTFSKRYLFEPIGIDSTNWAVRFPNGVIETAGGLKMTPRDMTKIGVLFLEHGNWNGEPLLSQQWVQNTKTPYPTNKEISVPGEDSKRNGYSYSWWVTQIHTNNSSLETFYASGWGGQKILIIPKLDTVIIFTGGNYTSKTKQFKILEKYLIPALLSI